MILMATTFLAGFPLIGIPWIVFFGGLSIVLTIANDLNINFIWLFLFFSLIITSILFQILAKHRKSNQHQARR